MYTVLLVGSFFILGVGIPLVVWLTKLIHPPKPEDEVTERRVEAARRRLDRTYY
jgi:hypothetical protein